MSNPLDDLPKVSMQISGEWVGTNLADAARRPFVNAPRGARWPWYPAYRGQAELAWTGDARGIELRPVGPLTKGRVGWKLWVTTHWRRIRRTLRSEPA